MLRPEQMSKVSVTGSKRVLETVIETIHELHLVHLSDYDGSWPGFDNGNPLEGADEAAEKLVTVRALESTLGLEGSADRAELEDGWGDRLEDVRTQVNALDDERDEIRNQLRQVGERLDRIEPFAELGIDLDLLSGYDSVDILVGAGDHADVDTALEAADGIRAYETFTGGDVVAIVAAPTGDDPEGIIDDALVGLEFTRYEVPETDKHPEAYVADLEDQRRDLEADLEEIDVDLEQVRFEHGEFLLRIERALSIEAQQADAPLQFATTNRAFVAEGWVPTAEYDRLVAALTGAVGDSVEIEELERAAYEDVHDDHAHGDGEDGHGDTLDVGDEDEPTDADPEPVKAATDGGRGAGGAGGSSVAGADYGDETLTMDDQPPVILNNLTPAKPFELLVKMVSQPKYSELDPTLLVFLTYPFAFGFMIGDIGYGILYMLMGYGCWKLFDSDAGKALGTIGIWAGVFTILFGWLYDDIFGVHMVDFVPEGLYGFFELAGAGVLTKGLQTTEWALLWIILSLVFGLVHLNIGLVLGFINELSHGLKAAMYEKFSWILAMNGLFLWIFAHADAGSIDHGIGFLPDDMAFSGEKPEFLVGTGEEAVLYEFVGFAGVPEIVGIIGLVMFFVGFVMVGFGEGIAGMFETPAYAFGHVLSYLRMVAVLLAKGGMAFAVNLLVFGAWDTPDGYTNFALFEEPAAQGDVAFEGLLWLGLNADFFLVTIVFLLLAVVVFVLGHILVLLLGITAAGIQMLRLEYVEFFQKFYEGGGEEYEPFGQESGEVATRAAD